MKRTMRIGTIAVALTVCVAGFGVAASVAQAAATNTAHQGGTVHHERRTFADALPCRESLGFFFFTAVYDQQEHAHATRYTFTQIGTFTAYPIEVERDANGDPIRDENGDVIPLVDANGVPIQQPGETFTGRFQTHFGSRENANVSTVGFVLNINATGSQGTSASSHENGHVTTDGPGDPNDPATSVRVAFDKVDCR